MNLVTPGKKGLKNFEDRKLSDISAVVCEPLISRSSKAPLNRLHARFAGLCWHCAQVLGQYGGCCIVNTFINIRFLLGKFFDR